MLKAQGRVRYDHHLCGHSEADLGGVDRAGSVAGHAVAGDRDAVQPPDSLQRSLAPLATQADGQGDRSEALRLIGPAVQTWKAEVELDSTDRFDVPAPEGIRPQLALLELLIEPSSVRLIANQAAPAA